MTDNTEYSGSGGQDKARFRSGFGSLFVRSWPDPGRA
jgi:hypothetical protein